MEIRFCRGCVLLSLVPLAVQAADTLAERREEPTFRTNSEMIRVNASVVDRAERFVTDLKPEDFRVFQDGHEQKIVNMWLEETPVSAGIVLDVSGSMKDTLPLAKQAAKEFIGRSNPNDEFFVVTVGRRPKTLLAFETRTGEVVKVVNDQQSGGSTALLDSIYMACNYLRRSRNAHKALLVLSDGEDNNSRYSKRELVRVLEESNLTLYALGMGGHCFYRSAQPLPCLGHAAASSRIRHGPGSRVSQWISISHDRCGTKLCGRPELNPVPPFSFRGHARLEGLSSKPEVRGPALGQRL
jgi:Mg-chelatase subunit ChlD